MSFKDIIDFSDFVTPSEALDLLNQGVRKAFNYDSYAGQTRFVAVVLSNPIPMNVEDMKGFLNVPGPFTFDAVKDLLGLVGTPRRISKFTFRARILGENSPHNFLPDPCDPAYASDNAKILKIIAMHTLFISTEDYQLQSGKKLPARGDLVLVDLDNNIFGYDLQKGKFVDVVLESDASHNIASYSSGQNCVTSIAATFAAGGLGGGAGGASPGLKGLGPMVRGSTPGNVERVIDPAQPTDALFQRIVNNDPTLWPATVTNAGNAQINGTYGPVQLGYAITSRAQFQRTVATNKGPKTANHIGVDVGCPSGTPLYAVYPGVLTFNRAVVGTSTKLAVARVTSNITFADGTTATILVKYMHNRQHASNLAGQVVTQGQQIALSGGNRGEPGSGGTTGAHLHFEFHIDGKWQAAHYFYRGGLIDPATGATNTSLLTGPKKCQPGQHWWPPSVDAAGNQFPEGCYPGPPPSP